MKTKKILMLLVFILILGIIAYMTLSNYVGDLSKSINMMFLDFCKEIELLVNYV